MHPMEKTQTVICGHFITAENRGFGDGVGSRRKKVWAWGNEFKFLKKSSSMCVVAIIHKNSYARKY